MAKKVLRYFQGTKDLMLTYRRIFMVTEGVVSWKSVKQTLTTSSTYGGRVFDML